MDYSKAIANVEENGYYIIPNLCTDIEIDQIITCIENIEQSGDSFMQTKDLFAIRQLINNIPELSDLLFNEKMTQLIQGHSQSEYFLTKAIYFDKPSDSNWFVPFHQDLSISVDKKIETSNYSNWTFKKGQYGVQLPINILEDTITVRIHLDKTDANNGALEIIPKSHLNGITRKDSKHWNTENEYICNVEKGGVMLMKPLTLHASSRTTNGQKRRVIHLEFNKHLLTKSLSWLEYHKVQSIA